MTLVLSALASIHNLNYFNVRHTLQLLLRLKHIDIAFSDIFACMTLGEIAVQSGKRELITFPCRLYTRAEDGPRVYVRSNFWDLGLGPSSFWTGTYKMSNL